MTLPGSRRPPELQRELELERQEIEKSKPIVVVLKRVKAFYDNMVSWYEKLSKQKQQRLTDEDVKWRALYVCHHLNFTYEKLPLNWVREVQERGVSFHIKKHLKYRKAILKEEAEANREDKDIPSDSEDMKFLKKLKQKVPSRNSERLVAKAKRRSEQAANKEEILRKEISKTKPKLEFLNTPPPDWWIKAEQSGKRMKKTLKHYHDQEMNKLICFYDYQRPAKDEMEMVILRHNRFIEKMKIHQSLLHALTLNAFMGDAIPLLR